MQVQQRIRSANHSTWGMPFVMGVLVAALGVIAFMSAPIAGAATVMVLGLFMVIAGIVEMIHSFSRRHEERRWVHLLSGILSAVVGGLLLARTGIGLAAITLMLAGYFIADGLFHTITAVADRHPSWGQDLAFGILSLLLGGLVLSQWPVSSLWLLGTLVGIEIFFRGCALMATGLALRKVARRTASV